MVVLQTKISVHLCFLEVHLEPCRKSMTELFLRVVNGYLTVFPKKLHHRFLTGFQIRLYYRNILDLVNG